MENNRMRGNYAQKNYRARRDNRRENRATFAQVFKEQNSDVFDMSKMLEANRMLRRHVSLAIIEYMKAKGQVTEKNKVFVRFNMTHLTIKIDGLGHDIHYGDECFLVAFKAAIDSISLHMAYTLNNLCCAARNEPINECDLYKGDNQKAIEAYAESVFKHIMTAKDTAEQE